MPLETGTLILTHYTVKVKDTGEIIETTRDEDAKKYGIYDPTKKYEPKLISVGEGWVLKGVDEALLSANVGDKLTIEIPPEKGFGLRDPNKVKMIPLRKFGDKASELRVNEEVEIDNKIGIVRYIGSGRVQVDFNHKYAGKVLVYDLEIVKKLESDKDKVIALIRRRLPMEEDKVNFTIDNFTLRLNLPSEYYLIEGLQIIKRAISNDIFKFLPQIKKVEFIETYEQPKPKEEVKAPQAPIESKAEVTTKVEEKVEVGTKEKVAKPKRRKKEST
ncbi:MAG: FKBP-type peptidyl-prolyl cis-trans isomerase [Nitrososphaerales archaeon]